HDERRTPRWRARAFGEVNAPLQMLEAGWFTVVIERDNLAVEDQPIGKAPRPGSQRFDDLRELRRLLVAETGPQPDTRRSDFSNCPDAVVFWFVNEIRVGQRRIDERRKHRAQNVVQAGSRFEPRCG